MTPPLPTEDDVRRFHQVLSERAHGRQNALTARELARLLGLGPGGDRQLRLLAGAANQAGLLVCADNRGYFCPASAAEAKEAIGRLRSQAVEMLRRAEEIRRLVERHFRPKGGPRQLGLEL